MKNREIFGAVSPNIQQAKSAVNTLKKTGFISDDNSFIHYGSIVVSFPNVIGQRTLSPDSHFEFPDGWLKIYGSFVPLSETLTNKEIAEKLIFEPEKILYSLYTYIDGYYVILSFNKRNNVFSIITDRLGMLHFYCRYIDDFVFFSTSSTILASLISFPELNDRACLEYAATGMMFEERTFYAGISKFRSATVNTINVAGPANELSFHTEKIWNYGHNMGDPINSLTDATALMAESLAVTSKSVLDKYPQPLCDLTGGFDSRMVLTGLLSASDSLFTMTAGKESRDAAVAADIAGTFNLPHHQIDSEDLYSEERFLDDVLKSLHSSDGELGIVETFGPFLIQKNNSRKYLASINGSGGEIHRGYWWDGEGSRAGKTVHLNRKKFMERLYPFGCNWNIFLNENKFKCEEYIEDYILRKEKTLLNELNTKKIDSIYADVRMERWAGRFLSSSLKLLPAVSPLILGSFLELSFRIHPLIKKNNQVVRAVINSVNQTIAKIPMSDGSPAYPVQINNFHRFFPSFLSAAHYYSNRLTEKIFRTGNASHPSKESKILQRLDLYGVVNDILNFDKMKTSFLYDKIRFTQFIQSCKCSNFQYQPHQLSRVLTLEWIIRECLSNTISFSNFNKYDQVKKNADA